MRIYNRNGRSHAHYTLRVLRSQFTMDDWWALMMGLSVLAMVIPMPVTR